jgi:hypothetical protein
MPEHVSLTQVAALAAQLPPSERRQLAETILRDWPPKLARRPHRAGAPGARFAVARRTPSAAKTPRPG